MILYLNKKREIFGYKFLPNVKIGDGDQEK